MGASAAKFFPIDIQGQGVTGKTGLTQCLSSFVPPCLSPLASSSLALISVPLSSPSPSLGS